MAKEKKVPKQTKKQAKKLKKLKESQMTQTEVKQENGLLKVLTIVLEVIFVVVFIFFEELVWRRFALPIKDYLASLKALQKTQVWIESQALYPTLAIFLLPLAVAEWMGIYSGALIISGSVISGVILYIIKIPVAGLTFWIFSFTKVKLLTIDWFKTLYDLLMRFVDFVKSTRIYRKVQYNIYRVKRYIKAMKGDGAFTNEIGRIYQGLQRIFKETK